MSVRFVNILLTTANHPIQAIQTTIAVMAFLIAAFIVSPAFVPAASPAIAQAFNSLLVGKIIIATLVLLPTIPVILGLFFKKFQTVEWYTRSSFFMFIGLLFLTLIRLITIGIFPIVWVPLAAITVVMAICWIYWKSRA